MRSSAWLRGRRFGNYPQCERGQIPCPQLSHIHIAAQEVTVAMHLLRWRKDAMRPLMALCRQTVIARRRLFSV